MRVPALVELDAADPTHIRVQPERAARQRDDLRAGRRERRAARRTRRDRRERSARSRGPPASAPVHGALHHARRRSARPAVAARRPTAPSRSIRPRCCGSRSTSRSTRPASRSRCVDAQGTLRTGRGAVGVDARVVVFTPARCSRRTASTPRPSRACATSPATSPRTSPSDAASRPSTRSVRRSRRCDPRAARFAVAGSTMDARRAARGAGGGRFAAREPRLRDAGVARPACARDSDRLPDDPGHHRPRRRDRSPRQPGSDSRNSRSTCSANAPPTVTFARVAPPSRPGAVGSTLVVDVSAADDSASRSCAAPPAAPASRSRRPPVRRSS